MTGGAPTAAGPVTIGPEALAPLLLAHEVTAFLHAEARLLDEERYDDWLQLLTHDVHYWMPVIENRLRSDSAGSYDGARMAYFDDRLDDLRRRVARFHAPSAWPEDPQTRHLHVVSNVEVIPAADPGEVLAHSVVVNYRNSRERDEAVLFARREDVLRRVDGELRLARRTILLRQNVLLAKNISTFL
jgi:ethylbenzene dioxygenase beta subunit